MSKTPYPIRKGFKRVSGLFAFWSYDLYPYVLGGPVMAMDKDGRIQSASYGGGVFKPIKLVPLKTGDKLMADIRELQIDHALAKNELEAEWFNKVRAVLPEVPE